MKVKSSQFVLFLLFAGLAGGSSAAWVFSIQTVDLFSLRVNLISPSISARIIYSLAVIVLCWVMLLLLRHFPRSTFYEPRQVLTLALMPVAGLIMLSWGGFGLIGVCLFIMILTLLLGRVWSQLQFSHFSEFSRFSPLVFLVVFCAGYAILGWFVQCRAQAVLLLQWHDWGHYYELLRNTLAGNFFYLNEGHGNFLGSRFCPALLILLPYVAVFNSPESFFLLGSLLVTSGAFAIYFLARSLHISRLAGVGLGCGYLLLPGIFNLNLSPVDGFHEIYLAIPVCISAFACYERKWYWLAAFLVVFSMFIRETMPLMYLGWAIAFAVRGRYRDSLWLGSASILIGVFIFCIFMPVFREGSSGYGSISYFAPLGHTFREVILSPFLHPSAFFGIFFSYHNLIFVILLVLPAILLGGNAFWCWFALLPEVIIICVDSRGDSANIVRHYQAMLQTTLAISMVYGYKNWQEERLNWLAKLMTAGLPVGNWRAFLPSTLAGMGVCWVFFVIYPFGWARGGEQRLTQWSDVRTGITEFTALMEPGSEVTAGTRLASHLTGKYNVFHDLEPEGMYPLKRYVFIEGLNRSYGEYNLRDWLLKSPNYVLLKKAYWGERLIMLFKQQANVTGLRVPVQFISDDAWKTIGVPVSVNHHDFAVHIKYSKSGGNGLLLLYFRVMRLRQCDAAIKVELSFADGTKSYFATFGGGVYPAHFAKVGDSFLLKIPCSQVPASCYVELRDI